jgi:hypothetical protein
MRFRCSLHARTQGPTRNRPCEVLLISFPHGPRVRGYKHNVDPLFPALVQSFHPTFKPVQVHGPMQTRTAVSVVRRICSLLGRRQNRIRLSKVRKFGRKTILGRFPLNHANIFIIGTGRSLDHRNPKGAQHATSARSGFLIVFCIDCTPASFSYASASFTHSHTLSLDSYCRPAAGKSSSPAGLSTIVYAYVVDCATASPYAYSSSTHRFPDELTPIEATPLSVTSTELGLGLGLGLGLNSLAHFSSHALPFFSPPSIHTLSLFSTFTSVWWSD